MQDDQNQGGMPTQNPMGTPSAPAGGDMGGGMPTPAPEAPAAGEEHPAGDQNPQPGM